MKAADLVRWRKGQSRWRLVWVNAYGKKPGRDEGWALNWPTMLNHRDLDLFMRRQGAATAASGIAPLQGHAWRMELFPACFRKPADTGSEFGVVCLFMGKMVRPVHVHREARSGKRCEGAAWRQQIGPCWTCSLPCRNRPRPRAELRRRLLVDRPVEAQR